MKSGALSQFLHHKKLPYAMIFILLLLCVLLFLWCTRPLSPDDLLEKRKIQKITISRIVSVPGADGGSQTETISTSDPAEVERILALLREFPVNRRIKLFGSNSSTTVTTYFWLSIYYEEESGTPGILVYDVSSDGNMRIRPWREPEIPCGVGWFGNRGILRFYQTLSDWFAAGEGSAVWQEV
ncbi:hypothetical protein [Clostridium sp. D33t1_170424_F3]|uniref:hypothetical protein n=1 Tax=Clostridium sp. D33t1_170424_F3 TaxID=2787099 RepID=UPI0018A89184|nr:hypothetical protein [Clostridium sp. D33t1_170424_F3]